MTTGCDETLRVQVRSSMDSIQKMLRNETDACIIVKEGYLMTK